MMSTDGSMTLVMTEEAATAECPSHELVSMLAQTCGIQEQHHITLLLIALGKSSLKSIKAAFLQQGIKVEGLLLGTSPHLDVTLLNTSRKRPNTSLQTTLKPKKIHFTQLRVLMRCACPLRSLKRWGMV